MLTTFRSRAVNLASKCASRPEQLRENALRKSATLVMELDISSTYSLEKSLIIVLTQICQELVPVGPVLLCPSLKSLPVDLHMLDLFGSHPDFTSFFFFDNIFFCSSPSAFKATAARSRHLCESQLFPSSKAYSLNLIKVARKALFTFYT